MPTGSAYAADGATVTISPTAPEEKPSGSDFSYDIGYACSDLGSTGIDCQDVTITIPLGDLTPSPFSEADLLGMFEFPAPTPVESFSIVDGELVIELGEVEAGASSSFPFVFTPPNHFTPDGTGWEFTPTISGEGISDYTSAETATGSATATLTPQISKTVVGTGFRKPGDTVTFQIVVECTQTSAGNILAETMTVTDTLPDGLSFVGAVPAPDDANAVPLSWTLDPLPASCTTPGSIGTTVIEVEVVLDDPIDETLRDLENVAGVSATTTDGQSIPEKTDDAHVTVLHDDAPGIGTFSKSSFAQLRDEGSTSQTQTEANSHTTYPGSWTAIRDNQPANVLASYTPNQATNMRQSGYKMQYNSGVTQGSGTEVEIVDPMPCLAADESVEHTSNDVGDLCESPAFIPTSVSVWSSSAGIDPLDAASYQPFARLADGSTVPLTHTDHDGTNAASYLVPATASPVAEIVFPADPGLSGQYIRWAVFGYASIETENLDVVENTAHGTVFWEGEQIGTVRYSAELYIIEAPQTGIDKQFQNVNQSAGTATVRLSARIASPNQLTEAFTITDLLPEGMSVSSFPSAIEAELRATDETGNVTFVTLPADEVVVIPNYANSGRELFRVEWSSATLSPYLGTIGLVVDNIDLQVQVSAGVPAVYDNVAQVYYTDESLSEQCQQEISYTQETVEAIDLNGNGSLNDRHCFATASLRIEPIPGSASFKATKLVQGADDDAPQSYPGIGTVGLDGGAVDFFIAWQNTGATVLSNAVVYDLLPAVGDVGVGGSSAGVDRGSDFAAVLLAVEDVSSGVEIWYSISVNPCRDEVFPDADNPDCVDDWTTTPPSDLTTVTGIKAVGAGPYAFGEGFGFTVNMTVPTAIASGEVAWNSIAANAQRPDSSWMQPSAPPKVGITAEALPMISKELAPGFDASELLPGDPVEYLLSIANPSAVDVVINAEDVLGEGLEFISITPDLSDPDLSYDAATRTISWNDYPIPARTSLSWTVVAQVAEGASGALENTFRLPDGIIVTPVCEEDADASCVTVTVAPGSIAVQKFVTGDGAHLAPAEFLFRIQCSYGGETVVDVEVPVAGGGVSDPVEVPVGSECTVTETYSGGATESAAETVVQIDSLTPVVVDVTNDFTLGELALTKTLAGAGAVFGEGDEFTFSVTCVRDGRTLLEDYRVTVTGSLSSAAPAAKDYVPVMGGAECTIEELDHGDADSPAVRSLTSIVPGTRATQNIVNVYSAGVLTLEKEVVGDLAAEHQSEDFELEVTCERRDSSDVVDWSHTGVVTIAAGERVPFADEDGEAVLLPVGARCFAEETVDGGATKVEIAHRSYETGVLVEAGGVEEPREFSIRVVNTFAGVESVGGDVDGAGGALSAAGLDDSTKVLAVLAALLLGGGLLMMGAATRRRHRRSH